jgi:hypothetical protein
MKDRYLNVLQSRLRNRCSALNSDLYRANLIPNALCSCGKSDETAKHYCCKQKEKKEKKRTIKIIFRGQSRTVNKINIKTPYDTVVNLW